MAPTRSAPTLTEVRDALGVSVLERGGALVLEGRTERSGLVSPYTLLADARGRFLLRIGGPLPEAWAFDGRGGWATDWSGRPRPLELADLEAAQLEVALLTGLWSSRAGPFAVRRLPDTGGPRRFAILRRDGRLRAELRVARRTGRPTSALRRTLGGEETWGFSRWTREAGLLLPWRASVRGGPARAYQVSTVRLAPPAELTQALERPAPPPDARFEPHLPARLRLARGRSGHAFVRVRTGSSELGWFLLDTGGGGATLVDQRLLPFLQAEAVGRTTVGGVFGTVRAPVLRAADLRIGPLVLTRPFVVALDLGFLAPLAEFPVAGVLGWDLFSRVVAEIELGRDRVVLRQPARYRLHGGRWTPLNVHMRHPMVEAVLEGRRGRFKVDLGAAGGAFGNLTVHAPTVARERLLAGRETRPARFGENTFRFGRVVSLRLGGRRFAQVGTAFACRARGAFADPYADGNLGVNVLRFFRLVLDLGNARAAWMKA